MKTTILLRGFTISLMLLASVSLALAGPIAWTDWTSASTGQVDGSLAVGSETVDVTFSGNYSFAQTNGGTNYWNPSSPYISSDVDNAPPASDIIGLSTGGAATITFSQPVEDPLLALVSWNGNTVDFGVPIEILSYGAGYWGNGTPLLNTAGTGFYGSGEVHGVIMLPGTYSSISFTHTSEGWHGFTVGASGIGGEISVPEPSILVLLAVGLIGLASVRKKIK